MSRISAVLPAMVLSALMATSAQAADSGKQLYKWVDENGVVHFGDQIPPQYAKQERSVLNERGVEIGRLDAEKSEAQRQEDSTREQTVAQARQRDQILLTTYVSVEQIEQLRDQRLEQIESQVKVTDQYIVSLQARVNQLHTRAQLFRPYSSNANAKPMPDLLAEDLVRAVNERRVQERNLAAKRAEQAELRTTFHSDIERYKELKGLRR